LSSAERTVRLGLAAAALALLVATAGCGSDQDGAAAAASPTPTGTPADATTRGLAEVEFARQCTVASVNYADEAEITADLDDRLAAAGFTHAQWKRWHDALVESPELVAQFAEISAAGCPPA
jgi:predicted outer membrane protein